MKTLHVSKWTICGFGDDVVVFQSKANNKEFCVVDVARLIVGTSQGEAPIIVRSQGDHLHLSSKVLSGIDLYKVILDHKGVSANAGAASSFVVSNWDLSEKVMNSAIG